MTATPTKALALAQAGTIWQGRERGACCPVCGERMLVTNTKQGVRYCRCRNPLCLLGVMGVAVKAVGQKRRLPVDKAQ